MVKVEVSVIQYICDELEVDEMTFVHPIFKKIHEIYQERLNENELIKSSYLKSLPDQDIVRAVVDIEANETEVSVQWLTKYNIDVRSDGDRLNEAVPRCIYAFKLQKVKTRLAEITQEFSKPHTDEELTDLMIEQIRLDRVKVKISEQLGRIIL